MKNKGWTLAEMMVAMVILIILCAASMSIVKGINVNKAKIFLYATMKNFGMAHGGLLEKFGSFSPTEDTTNTTETDWYCINMADFYTLKSNPKCNKTEVLSNANIQLPNNTSVYGLSQEWDTPWVDAPYSYKEIMVDIDGNSGSNKIGIDRFPLRVYRGNTIERINLDGMVYPVNCNTTTVYDATGTTHSLTKHKYCGSNSTNFYIDDELITYDIYRKANLTDEYASIVVSGRSLAEADCSAYGGLGFFSKYECNAMGYSVHPKCAKTDVCEMLVNETNKTNCQNAIAINNPDEQTCFSIIHKPSSGLGMIAGSMFDQMN